MLHRCRGNRHIGTREEFGSNLTVIINFTQLAQIKYATNYISAVTKHISFKSMLSRLHTCCVCQIFDIYRIPSSVDEIFGCTDSSSAKIEPKTFLVGKMFRIEATNIRHMTLLLNICECF